MPRSNGDHAFEMGALRTQPEAASARRVALLSVAVALLWIVAWHGSTARSIVTIWYRSPTFAHGFIIVPFVLWLVWRKRAALAECTLRPWWPGLGLLALAGLGWLVSSEAGVSSGMYFMFTVMLPLAVWTIAGTAVARTLAFPLGYLFFAVPFGEFLVPPLMDWTANFAIGALRASGVPVFREGIHFAIPSGRWSVVEECSGINYLIASLAVGTLYAYLAFRTLRRRALFVLLCAVVPLVANGVRAYVIVMMAHLTDNRLAVGVDHLLVGWVLFGGVMVLLFWLTSFLPPERVAAGSHGQPGAAVEASSASAGSFVLAAFAVVACVSLWRPAALALEDRGQLAARPLAPVVAAGGWTAVQAPLVEWTPEFANPSETLSQVFAKNGDRVGLEILVYRDENEDRKLITTTNHLVSSTNRRWRATSTGETRLQLGGDALTAGTLRFHDEQHGVLAWHWYWIDGRKTASPALGKLYQAASRLAGSGGSHALIVVYTLGDRSSDDAGSVLGRFVADMHESIDLALRNSSKQ